MSLYNSTMINTSNLVVRVSQLETKVEGNKKVGDHYLEIAESVAFQVDGG